VEQVGPDGATATMAYWGRTSAVVDANGHRRESVSDARGRLATVRESTAEPQVIEVETVPQWHSIGSAVGEAWVSPDVSEASEGHLTYGPYQVPAALGPGQVVRFRLAIDVATGDTDAVARVDVHDFTTGQDIAQRTLYRQEFPPGGLGHFRDFALTFDTTGLETHELEYRVWWLKRAKMAHDETLLAWSQSLNTTTYAYDEQDNLTDVWDAADNHTQMEYDSLGRKTWMHDPDMGEWYYGYDTSSGRGNLLYQVDARRQAVNFYYDELNRLVGKTYVTEVVDAASYQRPDPPPDDEYDVWYDYDEGQYGIGQRTSMGNRQASSAWGYDERGRMVRESKTIGEIGPFDTTYSYDALDRVVSTTYPDGEVVEQSYDAGAQPDSLGSSQGETFVSGTEYNALGQPVRVGYGSGLETRYAYFGLDTAQQWGTQFYGRLFQVCVIQGGADCPANDQSDALLNLSYWYDAGGNVTGHPRPPQRQPGAAFRLRQPGPPAARLHGGAGR
jgi:YD repeat-containing protein